MLEEIINNFYWRWIENNNALQGNRIDRRSFGDDLPIQKSFEKKANGNNGRRNSNEHVRRNSRTNDGIVDFKI